MVHSFMIPIFLTFVLGFKYIIFRYVYSFFRFFSLSDGFHSDSLLSSLLLIINLAFHLFFLLTLMQIFFSIIFCVLHSLLCILFLLINYSVRCFFPPIHYVSQTFVFPLIHSLFIIL